MAQTQGTGGEPNDERRKAVLFETLEPKVELILEGQTGLVRRFNEFEQKTDKRLDQFEEHMVKGFKQVWEELRRQNQRNS